jgi:hypothetical protein
MLAKSSRRASFIQTHYFERFDYGTENAVPPLTTLALAGGARVSRTVPG